MVGNRKGYVMNLVEIAGLGVAAVFGIPAVVLGAQAQHKSVQGRHAAKLAEEDRLAKAKQEQAETVERLWRDVPARMVAGLLLRFRSEERIPKETELAEAQAQ